MTHGKPATPRALLPPGRPRRLYAMFFGWLAVLTLAGGLRAADTAPVRLMVLEPGHFHAALFQKEMLPEIAERVHVYAPLGPDLLAHLNRIAQFNSRPVNPTRWELEVHTSSNSLERLLAERPGNVVVLSGNNRAKIERIAALVGHGLHVLADKPWIIEPEEFTKLAAALEVAERKGVAAYDAMTQRFEVSCLLPRELVNDPDLFGQCQTGSPAEPAARMESVHYFLKEVAGVPSLRPAWFFDVRQAGEGLADVGTHLVDLIQWTLFPDQPIDYQRDIVMHSGSHWPTVLSLEQFERVTGEKAFPACVQAAVRQGALECYANNRVIYRLRGVWVRLDIRWEFAPPPGGRDTEHAEFRGTRSRIEVRQGRAEQFVPEVYVIPNRPEEKTAVRAALTRRLERLQAVLPGLRAEDQGERLHVVIPEQFRIGHEAHFALLIRRFLNLVRDPKSLPAWEKPNMLAKYYVTTQGVKLARETAANQSP